MSLIFCRRLDLVVSCIHKSTLTLLTFYMPVSLLIWFDLQNSLDDDLLWVKGEGFALGKGHRRGCTQGMDTISSHDRGSVCGLSTPTTLGHGTNSVSGVGSEVSLLSSSCRLSHPHPHPHPPPLPPAHPPIHVEPSWKLGLLRMGCGQQASAAYAVTMVECIGWVGALSVVCKCCVLVGWQGRGSVEVRRLWHLPLVCVCCSGLA